MSSARVPFCACVLAALVVCGSWTSVSAQSIAQWDFEGSLEASTDHDDLLEEIVPPGFETQVDQFFPGGV